MNEFRKKSIQVFLQVNLAQRFYLLSISSLLVLAIGTLTGFSILTSSGIISIFIFSLFGIISDLLGLYKKVWGTLIGKGIILTTYAVSTNFALSVSYQILNEIIGVEPKMLSYSLAFTSILTIPFFVIFAFMALFAMILLFGQIYMFLALQVSFLGSETNLSKIMPKLEVYPWQFFIIRVLVYPAVIGLIMGLAKSSFSDYSSFLSRTVKTFVYNMEAVKYSRCQLLAGEKSITINEREIILVYPQGNDYLFSHVLCKPKL